MQALPGPATPACTRAWLDRLRPDAARRIRNGHADGPPQGATWPTCVRRPVAVGLNPQWRKSALFVSLAVLPASLGAALQNTGQKEVAIAAQGYLANREAFPFFRCRIEAVDAKADSVQAAIAGKLFDYSPRSDGVWVVDGEKTYLRLSCDESHFEAALAKARKENSKTVPHPYITDHFLSDGRLKLRSGVSVKVANFYTPEQEFPETYYTTWRTGVASVGTLLQDCLEGRKFGRFEGYDDSFGKGLWRFSVGFTSEKDICARFLLDPNRGFLPVCYWLITDDRKAYTQEIITEFEECSGRRWFPKRLLVILLPEEKPPYRVSDYRVSSLDAEHRPTAKDFEMDLTGHGQVRNAYIHGPGYMPKAGEKVNVEELAELGEKRKRIAEQGMRDPEAPPKPFQWHLFVGANDAFLCVVAGVLGYRRLRRGRPTGGTRSAPAGLE